MVGPIFEREYDWKGEMDSKMTLRFAKQDPKINHLTSLAIIRDEHHSRGECLGSGGGL
jgi:hypothetical protein